MNIEYERQECTDPSKGQPDSSTWEAMVKSGIPRVEVYDPTMYRVFPSLMNCLNVVSVLSLLSITIVFRR